MTNLWHTSNKSSEHYWMPQAGIHIYDGSCIDVPYMLDMGWNEQIERKSHGACCENNYKKNKKIIILWHTLKRSCEHYCSVGTSIHIYDGSCIDVYYKLGIGRAEQTVEKSHVACVENNYKKNKKK